MNSDISNDYHNEFTRDFKKLDDKIVNTSSSGTEIDMLKTEVISLKKKIESVAHLLPKYQQLSYSDQVQALLDKITLRETPQRRFRLNRDRITSRSRGERQKSVNLETKEEIKEEKKPSHLSRSHEIIKITEKSSTLQNITKSIILTTDGIQSVTLKSITDSIIVINSIGPAFLFNLKNCIVFVTCHQLRIHDSDSTKFIANIKNNIGIIENSKNLSFNEGVQVKDFNHPFGNSPNFTSFKINDEIVDLREKVEKNPTLDDLESFIK